MVSLCRRFCQRNGYLLGEILVRFALFSIIACTEKTKPFQRKLQPEELWLYKYPRTDSYVPTEALVTICTLVPMIVFMVTKFILKEKADAGQGCLGLLLALGLNGVVTNLVKIAVGRPRPDFMYRCFPDGRFNNDLDCTGDPDVIADGRKSFPSGHSSFSFLSMGFTAMYIAGKLQCFVPDGRGKSYRFCLMLAPLFLAAAIAISRTCDYHHHWQGEPINLVSTILRPRPPILWQCFMIACSCLPYILAGSIIGFSLAHLCYRQYFPSLGSAKCSRSYVGLQSGSSSVAKDDLTTIKCI